MPAPGTFGVLSANPDMPARTRVDLAVQRRLRSLGRGLNARLDTDAEALHRTRVVTRRLREALPLFGPDEEIQPLSDLVQHVTRALGGVREMDVALALVDSLAGERPDLKPALDLVRSALAAERVARLHRMRQEVDARALRRASRTLAERAGEAAANARPTVVLAERLAERADDLRRAVSDAGLLYAPERLHRVRIATKKLRYGLELADEVGVASTRRLVADLKGVQERLGMLHDLESVARHARQALAEPGVPDATARLAAPTLSMLEGKIHARHADYVANRVTLVRVVDHTLTVCRRLRRDGRARPADDRLT